MRDLVFSVSSSLLLTSLVVFMTNIGFAQVMSSSNYKIQSDSVNFAGGHSSSTNYQVRSTGGEVGTGESSSASYTVRSGYQQMQESYLALSGTGTVVLSPSIPGVSGGTATGSTTITVTTDNLGGYNLSIKASTNPAMQSGVNTIADYTPGGADPDFTFTTGLADAHFGFSPEGADVVQRFLDNGVICNQSGGSDTADKCWDGLSTTAQNISAGSASNHPTGTETVIKFQVGIGGSVIQPAGSYIATTTITAIAI